MIKKTLLFTLYLSYAFSDNNTTLLQDHSTAVTYTTKTGQTIKMNIGRDMNKQCKELPLANGTFWDGNYANPDVPDGCKATFVTTSGHLSPMKIHDGVETFGELEVLEFIEEMQEDKTMLLIDTRKPLWYEYRTIPTAINIPFEYFLKPKEFKEGFEKSLKILGVTGTQQAYDFSHAKTITLFCNAAWCGQSPAMIRSLIALGYPAQKIKWYRGGMASWLGLNMTATRK